jgi:hypothetical protein
LSTREGVQLLLPPAANNELLYGNPLTMDPKLPATAQQPSEAARAQIRVLKQRLNVTVDMAGANVPQSQRVGDAMQEHVKPKLNDVPANVPRNPDGTVKHGRTPDGKWKVDNLPPAKANNLVKVVPDPGGKGGPPTSKIASHPSLDNTSESDRLVLSQIKAGAQARGVKNPVMITAETGEKGMISQAKVYGITARKPASRTSGSPPPVAPKPPPAPPAAPPKTVPAKGGASTPATAVKTLPAKGGAPTPATAVKTAPARGGASTRAPAVKTAPLRVPTVKTVPTAPGVANAPLPRPGGLAFAARIATGVRIAGGFILMAAVQVLATWLKNRLDGMYIKSEINRLEPKIQAEISRRIEEVAEVQIRADRAYANVTVVVMQVFAGGISQGLPQVWFAGLDIIGRAVNTVGQTAAPPFGWTGPWIQRTDHTFSFEVKVFSDEEMKELDDLTSEFHRLNIMLYSDTFDDDLRAQLQEFRKAIIEKFGPKVLGLDIAPRV